MQPRHRVLEIGTGSGYQAAVLSRLARYVYSVERYRTHRSSGIINTKILTMESLPLGADVAYVV